MKRLGILVVNYNYEHYRTVPTPSDIRHWASTTTAYPSPPGSGNAYARTFLDRIFPIESDSGVGSASDSACLAAAPFFGDVVAPTTQPLPADGTGRMLIDTLRSPFQVGPESVAPPGPGLGLVLRDAARPSRHGPPAARPALRLSAVSRILLLRCAA